MNDNRDQQMPAWYGTRCRTCGKYLYATRRDARERMRALNHRGLGVYRCPYNDGFHLGHRPPELLRGDVTSAELNGWLRTKRGHQTERVPNPVDDWIVHVLKTHGLDEVGRALAVQIAYWQRSFNTAPTWAEALANIDIPEELFIPPSDSEFVGQPDRWQAWVTTRLMELSRDAGWIRFDNRPRSLRPGPTATGVTRP